MPTDAAAAGPLPYVIRAFACVALLTGLGNAILGPDFLPDSQGEVEATLAQEFRFFAVWWFAAGLYLWSLANRIHTATRELRIVCGVLCASGLARWVSFATHGWPHPMFVALAVIEVVAPLPLVWWQARRPFAPTADAEDGESFAGVGTERET